MDASAGPIAQAADTQRPAPLRIGLLVDRPDGFENWQLALIDRLLADDRFHLEAILCPSRKQASKPLFRLAASLERKILGRQPDYTVKSPGFDELRVQPVDMVKEHVAGNNLDLVLEISPVDLPTDTFRHLPFGRWRVSFLDAADARADWFGYDDVIAGRAATELRIMVRRAANPNDETLARAAFNTKFSAVRNGDFIKERAVTLVMRELRKVAEMRVITPVASTGPPQAISSPGLRELLPYGVHLGTNLLVRGKQALQARLKRGAPAWALMTGRGDAADFDPRAAVLLKPDDDEFRADPFLFEQDGETFVFYEAYTARNLKAHIAVGRLVENRLERIGIALQADYHLSYPFVFSHNGAIFMIPETNQARRIEVWRCVEFPLRWELHATALNGQSAADTALVPFAGKWWLFTNLSEFHAYEDHCSELYLFEVDGPDLSWLKPHGHNPVVIGSTEARNGGRPFEREGRLYRPSQRNEHGIYGYGLNIMEIETLDLQTYRERCVRTIEPTFTPGIVACHHIDASNGRYIIDAMFADQSRLLR
jgi:hypothetical protein